VSRLRRFLARCRAALRATRWVWWWFRQVSGDAAYENYLQNAATAKTLSRGAHPDECILSREEFFLDAMRRRYSGVTRCC